MSQQLLMAACEQAERSETAVRAAALMHIARVLVRTDQADAEQLLEQGIALAKDVDRGPEHFLLRNAIALSAAVSAKNALPLYAEFRRADPFGGAVVALVNNMAQHGHIRDAISYLNEPLPGDRFPLFFVNNLECECRDDETRRQLLELAIREWQNPAPRNGRDERCALQSFTGLFGQFWNLVPREVAAPVLRELVACTVGMKPELREHSLTENPEDPRLPSDQEFHLFQLVPAAQHLDPDLAGSLLETRPQLAAAMKRFPLGTRSLSEHQWKYDPARDDMTEIGDSELMPIGEALATEFETAFQSANRTFAQDSNPESPNSAHKECWPSAKEFRHILFKAGQHQGTAAAKHLDRIPDPDLRLFAQIELCAGIAGLPQLGGLTIVRFAIDSVQKPSET